MRTQLLILGSVVMLLAACNAGGIDAKKAQLDRKKASLAELQAEIDSLTAQIQRLDTSKSTVKTIAVRTEEIQPTSFKNPFQIQGVVESDQNVVIAAEMGGEVLKIHVKEGQSVRKGQLLATLDGTNLSAQVQELKSALELAEVTYQKQEKLWNQNIGSEIQYLQAKNQVERLRSSLTAAQSQLGKFTLTSPINGTIDEIMTNEGQTLSPGMSQVMRVVNMQDIKIKANVSERYIGKVSIGEGVKVHYPSLDSTTTEKVSAVGSYINPDNRTFNMFILPKENTKMLRPNLLAIITAYDYTKDSAIVVPTKLIRNDGQQDYILTAVKNKNGQLTVQKKPIKIEASFLTHTVVANGLNPGDLIISEGYSNVIPGDFVKNVKE